MTMADRVSVMDRGRIAQIGTPAEIYEAPRTRHVAEFVGAINMIEAVARGVEGGVAALETPDGRALRVAVEGEAPAPGATAWLALRPEKMRISKAAPEDRANAARGEVWDIAYLGDMTVFNVRLPSGQVLKASVLNRSRGVEDPIGYEDEVWLTHEPDAGTLLLG